MSFGLAKESARVLLIDADQQASANAWSSLREDQPFSVVAIPRKNLHKEVARHRGNYDWIVIDGTPRDDAITRSCLVAADLVIIPIEPSALSAWAADRTVGQVEEARVFRPDLRAFFVVSRKIAGTILGREMRLLDLPLPVRRIRKSHSEWPLQNPCSRHRASRNTRQAARLPMRSPI